MSALTTDIYDVIARRRDVRAELSSEHVEPERQTFAGQLPPDRRQASGRIKVEGIRESDLVRHDWRRGRSLDDAIHLESWRD